MKKIILLLILFTVFSSPVLAWDGETMADKNWKKYGIDPFDSQEVEPAMLDEFTYNFKGDDWNEYGRSYGFAYYYGSEYVSEPIETYLGRWESRSGYGVEWVEIDVDREKRIISINTNDYNMQCPTILFRSFDGFILECDIISNENITPSIKNRKLYVDISYFIYDFDSEPVKTIDIAYSHTLTCFAFKREETGPYWKQTDECSAEPHHIDYLDKIED